MDSKMNLREVILAGVGSVAYSLEKGMEMVDELVKKGELTVNQGKELNQELKNKFSQAKQEYKAQRVSRDEFQELEARVTRLEKQLPS